MVRVSAFAVVLLVALGAPVRAESVDTAIADARSNVRRAAEPFTRQSEADQCAREVASALVVGREALQALTGEARAKAADALNLTTIHAAFGRVTATRGLDVTRDLLALDDARSLLDLAHLTRAQGELVLRLLTVLHGVSRLPKDALSASDRARVERDLDACEADLRSMLGAPELATLLRGLAHHHEQLVRESRARVEWIGGFTIHRTWPLAHVSTIVDRAYVVARTPGAGPQPEAREVELRGLPATTRTGAVLPCVVRLDAPDAPVVARWDVETIDAAGARQWLTHVAPASTSFGLFAPSRAGRYTVLVSALLEDDRVLARAFPLEVTGADVPTVAMDGRTLEEVGSSPSVGLSGALGRARSPIRLSIADVVVPGKGGSIQVDFDGATAVRFTLELVGPGGERRVICRDEPLDVSGTSLLVTLVPDEVPTTPSLWRVVVTARRADGTTLSASTALSTRGTRRIS